MKRFRIRPTHNQRGFLGATFLDSYDRESSVQESSSAEPHLWLGPNAPLKHSVTGHDLGCRMLLSRAQVRELVRVMQRWLDTGRLPRGRKSPEPKP